MYLKPLLKIIFGIGLLLVVRTALWRAAVALLTTVLTYRHIEL
jgi:hypothetical protein